MSSTGTFHPFSRLPAELRFQIWENAIDAYDSWVTVHIDTVTWELSHTTIPPASFYATRESRNVALKYSGRRKFCIGPVTTPATIYLSPGKDVLEVHLYCSEDAHRRREEMTWSNLDAALRDALRAAQHLHLSCTNINRLWQLWDIGDFPGGEVGLDAIFRNELLNLKVITESGLSLNEIHSGQYCFCPHAVRKKSCQVNTKSLRGLEVYVPTMVRTFCSYCCPEEPVELERGIKALVPRCPVKLPIEDEEFKGWGDEVDEEQED